VLYAEKKTLFGRVIQRIESELASKEKQFFSPNVPLNDNRINDDTAAIVSRRDELRATNHENTDENIILQ